jgi:hypothetical protein
MDLIHVYIVVTAIHIVLTTTLALIVGEGDKTFEAFSTLVRAYRAARRNARPGATPAHQHQNNSSI